MVQMAPVSSGQLPADSTAADDALHRRSLDCLRDGSSVGQNKMHRHWSELQSFRYKLLPLAVSKQSQQNRRKYLSHNSYC